MSNYGWIIDKDHLFDGSFAGDRDDSKVMGPRDIPKQIETILKTTDRGQKFKMYDDDGELYYSGRCIVDGDVPSESDEGFGPLWDFGGPNAGAVDIKYLVDGKWVSL